MFDAIAPGLAPFGWREGNGREGRPVLVRTLGPARQCIDLWLGDPSSYPSPPHLVRRYAAGFDLHFEIPEVQQALLGILPRWKSKRAKQRGEDGDAYGDIQCPPQDLFGREVLKPLGYTLTPGGIAVVVQSQAELQWWPQVFTGWFERQAEPLLAACTDLATLNRFINNPWRLATGMEQPEWNLMSTMVLAKMAPHPEVPWADVLTGVRYRADRLAMDEALLERVIAALEAAPARSL